MENQMNSITNTTKEQTSKTQLKGVRARSRCRLETVSSELQILHAPSGALFLFAGDLAELIDQACRHDDITPDALMANLAARC